VVAVRVEAGMVVLGPDKAEARVMGRMHMEASRILALGHMAEAMAVVDIAIERIGIVGRRLCKVEGAPRDEDTNTDMESCYLLDK